MVPLAVATAIAVEELLRHGYDITVALRRPWPIDPDVARFVLAGMTTVMPWFVEEAARGMPATCAIHISGGPDFVCRFDDGTLTVTEPVTGPIDCHIAADPVTFLLVAYRRVSRWGPIPRGKLRAWGATTVAGFQVHPPRRTAVGAEYGGGVRPARRDGGRPRRNSLPNE